MIDVAQSIIDELLLGNQYRVLFVEEETDSLSGSIFDAVVEYFEKENILLKATRFPIKQILLKDYSGLRFTNSKLCGLDVDSIYRPNKIKDKNREDFCHSSFAKITIYDN